MATGLVVLYLVLGIVAFVLLLAVPRFLGGRQERMLKEYEVLEKRFGLARHVARSKWGQGIAEHYRLAGEYRGYPLSLYSHFSGKGKERVEWTSVTLETLFAGELEYCIEFEKTEDASRFALRSEYGQDLDTDSDFSLQASEPELAKRLSSGELNGKLSSFAKRSGRGAVRLSKGFLEYREAGVMSEAEQRLRFQEAFVLLAGLADELSIYVTERSHRLQES